MLKKYKLLRFVHKKKERTSLFRPVIEKTDILQHSEEDSAVFFEIKLK